MVDSDDFKLISEEVLSDGSYSMTFECPIEFINMLMKTYGDNYEELFSKYFNDYVRSLKEGSNDNAN